ncbi:hypothetical protein C8J48_1618 [Desmospora activa DSM 45169]|uniref:Uncharacterized protein n=1 Tax=Desmospora activa DSM 45169 TaxID=1121389 RepID=A0A2T4ZAV1_9BACL|nr:hypothetical protein C8J48_1618 [Desmospora activa DSM 45169]
MTGIDADVCGFFLSSFTFPILLMILMVRTPSRAIYEVGSMYHIENQSSLEV